jgi:DNA-binding MarR family transcriptional regulator
VDVPPVHLLSAELALLVGRLNRALTRAAPLEVPTARLRLLSLVDETGTATIGELATADHCSQPTMSAAVQALCDLGWAAKTLNPMDARSSLVALTDQGRSMLADARRRRAAVVAELFEAHATSDERDLATAVAVLRGLLSPHPTHPPGPTVASTVHRHTHQGAS